MKMLSPSRLVVLLEGVDAVTAYNWGCEAGAFLQYGKARMLGEHIIYAGNSSMIEMLCAQRRMEMDVVEERGDMLRIMIKLK